VKALEVAQIRLSIIFQERHQITALMGQGIEVQTGGAVQDGMVVKMVVDKGKVQALDIGPLPKYGQVCIVGEYLIDGIHQGIGHRIFDTGGGEPLDQLGVAPVGLDQHITWTPTAPGLKVQDQADLLGPWMFPYKEVRPVEAQLLRIA